MMHVALWRIGEENTGLLWGNHLEDLGEDQAIILKWIFKEWDGWEGDCLD